MRRFPVMVVAIGPFVAGIEPLRNSAVVALDIFGGRDVYDYDAVGKVVGGLDGREIEFPPEPVRARLFDPGLGTRVFSNVIRLKNESGRIEVSARYRFGPPAVHFGFELAAVGAAFDQKIEKARVALGSREGRDLSILVAPDARDFREEIGLFQQARREYPVLPVFEAADGEVAEFPSLRVALYQEFAELGELLVGIGIWRVCEFHFLPAIIVLLEGAPASGERTH